MHDVQPVRYPSAHVHVSSPMSVLCVKSYLKSPGVYICPRLRLYLYVCLTAAQEVYVHACLCVCLYVCACRARRACL